MKSIIIVCLIAAALVMFGCSQEDVVVPDQSQNGDELAANDLKGRGNAPPQYYTHYWTAVGVSMEIIDTRHGEGIPYMDDLILDEYPGKGFVAPLGLTFDLDGTMYMINNWLLGEDPFLGELLRIDKDTGDITVIAEYQNHFCGSEIDACGNLYTVGFAAEEVYFSNIYEDKLCFIDKYTGAVEPIGDGTGLHNVMDLAFDSEGTLWGTTDNKLYTFDTETGDATFVTDIYGVPPAPPGETRQMEVMSIMFDKHDVLYGTAIVGFWETDVDDAPILRIDVETGDATLLGYSYLGYNHGGDNYPTKVKIAHRKNNGSYQCKTISINALAAHLAHGDYVPGTDGHDCDCP